MKKTADGAAAGGKKHRHRQPCFDEHVGADPRVRGSAGIRLCGVLREGRPRQPAEGRYLLPIYIDELLHADKVSVKVLPTHDKWFGVTHAEDKADCH